MSESDAPASPEPADDHDSIIPGLDPVAPGRPDQAPAADLAVSGDPSQPRGRRGGVLAAAGGGVALAAAIALVVLAVSQPGGQPGTAAAGREAATAGTSQPGATAGPSAQSQPLVPASQAGALSSAPNGGPANTGNAGGTGAAGATKPATTGTASSRTQLAPVDPGTSGELPPLAKPPASPTDSPNPVPPVPADRSVAVSRGPAIQPATGTCGSGMVCYSFQVSIANFPAHVPLAYTCADGGGVWYGPSTIINSGTNVTNSSGDASFITYCTHPSDGASVTVDVGGGGLSASGRYAT